MEGLPTTRSQELTDLPVEIISEIQSHLPKEDLAASEVTCGKLRTAAQPVWKNLSKMKGHKPEGATFKEHAVGTWIERAAEKFAPVQIQGLLLRFPELLQGKVLAIHFDPSSPETAVLFTTNKDDKRRLTSLDMWTTDRVSLSITRFDRTPDKSLFITNEKHMDEMSVRHGLRPKDASEDDVDYADLAEAEPYAPYLSDEQYKTAAKNIQGILLDIKGIPQELTERTHDAETAQ